MNLNYPISTIAKQINANVVQEIASLQIKTVFIDSRSYFDPNTSLFFALKGQKKDGHHYIEELYNKGLRSFVVDSNYKKKLKGANFLFVKDPLEALQNLAIFHRNQFNIPIIAITGSNGKTIIKEWLYHYLRTEYNIVRSPKSYNSQVGVPLSVLQINSSHTLGIFEAGISKPGEMNYLEKIINPTYGILSNIGTSHLENFTSIEALQKEKMTLLKNTLWFHNYKDNQLQNNRLTVKKVAIKEHFTVFYLEIDNKDYSCELPFTDKASIDNALSCINFLIKFGVSATTIISKTSSLPTIAFRLETNKGLNNNIIIRDNYNSNLTALSIALDYIVRFEEKNKVLILTDILQDKVEVEALYKEVAILVNQRKLAAFIGIGKQMHTYKHFFNHGVFYLSVEDFLQNKKSIHYTNSCILLKGTTDYRLDKINSLLVNKTHQTTLEINLTALKNNINHYQEKINNATKLMCMVKAFGYGSGSKEIARVLQYSNVDYLGVAYTDEGIELRKNGITIPIIVMNMESFSYDSIIEQNLEPSIYSINQLDEFIHYLIDLNIKAYPIHLKIDTGMNRLGFLENEIEELIAIIINQPEVYIKGIFSHLASVDDPNEDAFTLTQLNLFTAISAKIEEQLGYKTIKNILNSSGLERFNNYQFDMVRLGIGMYGISNTENLELVSALKTKVSQLKIVKKNTSIGYGRSYFTTKDTKIAIIPIGYADGFSRKLSNGKGTVFIKNKFVPVIGRVSMDMTMIDVSSIDNIKVNDEVEIFGKNKSIHLLAKELETIPYEILTSISSRVVRTYIEE